MDKKYMYIGTLLILLSLIMYIYIFKPFSKVEFQKKNFNINNINFELEEARTVPQLSLGLGNRSSLCEKCGMIFYFNFEGVLPFWMKDTKIPLDLIWINSNGIVVDIKTASVENNKKENELTIYKNTVPAKYVIELNSSTAKKINLKIGDFIKI